MSCCESCLQGSCSVPTGQATTNCSPDLCCQFGVYLPRSRPQEISLYQPTCYDTCPQPCWVPDSCLPSCWLLKSCHPTPNLSGISVITCIRPVSRKHLAASQRCFKELAHIALRHCNSL